MGYTKLPDPDNEIITASEETAIEDAIDTVVDWTVATSDTSTASKLKITQASSGDAAQSFSIAATRAYAIGIDNSAADDFVIATAAAGTAVLGTSNLLAINTAGDANLTGDLTITGGDLVTGAAVATNLVATTTTGAVNIATGLTTGALVIGTASDSSALTLGNGAGSGAVTLGSATRNVTVTGDLTVSGGDLVTGAAVATNLIATTTTGAVNIATGLTTGALIIGTASDSSALTLGNGAGSGVVTLGSATRNVTVTGDLTVLGGDVITGAAVASNLVATTTTGAVNIATGLTTGALAIGTASDSSALSLGTGAGTGTITVGSATRAVSLPSAVTVTDSSASTTPKLSSTQTSTGDAAASFILTGAASYAVGIDNSDSDKFKVSYNAAGAPVLGTSDVLVVDSSSNVTATTFIGALTGNASGTAATVTTAAQPAITSVGTLTSLAVGQVTSTGGLKVSGAVAGETAVSTGYINEAAGVLTVLAQGTDATTKGSIVLKVQESDQGGAVAGLTVNTDGSLTAAGALNGVTTLTATTLAGTLSTAAQTNVTSVGTLTALVMSGALSGVTTLGTTAKASIIVDAVGAPADVGRSMDIRANAAGAGYIVNLFHDGNDANRYGINIQAGADDGSGTTYYLQAEDGDGTVTGAISTVTGVFAAVDSSDACRKDCIAPSKVDAVVVLNALHCSEFKYKKHGKDGHLHPIGFIAQDVQAAFPEAVSIMSDGSLGVNKSAFIPVLVKAVQELSALVNELSARLEVLEGGQR